MPEEERRAYELKEKLRHKMIYQRTIKNLKHSWRGISTDGMLGVDKATISAIGDEVFGVL